MVGDSTFAGDVLSEILKLGVLLKLEEMFGTNVINVPELQITGQVVCYLNSRPLVRGSTLAGDVLSEILKLGVLLKLEEMFGTNLVNVQE